MLTFVEATAKRIDAVPKVLACRDPTGDKFLALAVAGGAAMILTGDRDILQLHPFRGIDILNPRQLLDRNSSVVG